MTSKRTVIGFAIATVWILSLVLLRQRLGPNEPVPKGRPPSDLHLAVLLGDDTPVGSMHLVSRPEERDGVSGDRFELDANVTLRLLGEPTELEVHGTSWRGLDPPSLEVEFWIASGGQGMEVIARTEGGRLRGEVVSAGQSTPIDLPLEVENLVAGGFGGALEFPALEPGETARIASFDPVTMSPGRALVRCVRAGTRTIDGEEVEVRELEIDSGGIRLRAFTDPDGSVVRAETPFGFVLERRSGDPEEAAPAAAAEGDLLALTAVRPTGPTPRRGATSLRLRVHGAPVDLPTDANQRSLGDGLFVIAPSAADGPAPADPELPTPADLASDALVQSDHPRIRRTARELLERIETDAEKARVLHDWVFEEIEKEPVMSVPSALAVLEARRGDCNEHTALYTALARAAGLPTRIAIGLVWSESWSGFYYHAWPRVWIGDRWIWTDPTLGQPVADATHLQLLEGGIEQWPLLLRWLGKIEIEIEPGPVQTSGAGRPKR